MSYFVFDELQIQLFICFAILFTSWLLLQYLKTPKNLPPGPWGFPIVGNAFSLGKKPHVTLANMKAKYGDIVRVHMGPEPIIFLSSYKAVKEALLKQADAYAGRPVPNIAENLLEYLGIIRSTGEVWSELRRFALSKLKDFGFGKSSLEPRIKDEIHHFLKEIEAFNGKPIPDMCELLRQSITNVICIVMTGERFDYQDKVFHKLLYLSNEHLRRLGVDRISLLIPRLIRFEFLLKLFGIKSALETFTEMTGVIANIVDKFDDKHLAERQSNFIDSWLTESKKNNNYSKYLTKKQLYTVLFDLFLAGSDTTTNTLGWSLLYMIEHPEIQTKAQKEIDNVIGKERTPSITDQKLMPYTEAILMEVNRIVTIVPLAIVHCTNCDTTLLGKFIPKGTPIVPNLWAVHNDPEIFPEPTVFRPERFLTADGQLKRVDEFVPFSLGKRQCMGESLAKMELFLYFTSMLQQFTFKKVDEKVDFDYTYAIVSMPKAQPIYAIHR